MGVQSFKWDRLSLGVCYYPEHWPKELWESDLVRMKEAGIETIRIAEFAWSKFEAKEGIFDFSFFDEFLDLCTLHDMKVIIGTPTATPPRWLTAKYPDVLNADKWGHKYRHGGRRHYNYNSEIYRELCARLVEQLAKHYADHPQVVGWQIDNELNCEIGVFYSEADEKAFRVFLQKKYKDIETLNQAWGTAFWNQDYDDFDQISFPVGMVSDKMHNPHQQLDYFRFLSDSTIAFCKLQSDILRKYIGKKQYITTNGIFWHVDNHRMQREALDVYTYDSYPDFAFDMTSDPKHSTNLNDRYWCRKLTETRSVCPNFGIMEQQSGPNGWVSRMEAPSPKPGQMTLWVMQSIAQGADFISFFRWRTCSFGTEIYWHGILNYDNEDNRRLAEVKQIRDRVRKMEDVAGKPFLARVGVIQSYDNLYDTECDVWHERVHWYTDNEIFAAAELCHSPYDYLYLDEPDLPERLTPENYPVVFCPHAVILTQEQAEILKEYVRAGGNLILGCRTGYKQENGKCVMHQMPGYLRDAAGCTVQDFTLIGPGDETPVMTWNGNSYQMPVFNDVLAPDEDTAVLACFEELAEGKPYYAGAPALLKHAYGNGTVYTVAGCMERGLVQALLEHFGLAEGWSEYLEVPAEVGLYARGEGEDFYLFVLNYMDHSKEIRIHKPLKDVDSGETVSGSICLKPYETKVYRL